MFAEVWMKIIEKTNDFVKRSAYLINKNMIVQVEQSSLQLGEQLFQHTLRHTQEHLLNHLY